MREAALAWVRERDAADALAHQSAEAEHLLGLPASPDVGATSSGSAGPNVSHTTVIWHDPTNPLVAQLQYKAGVSRTSVSLFRSSSNLSRLPTPASEIWSSSHFAATPDDHVLIDASVTVQTPTWLRLDSIVLSWILRTISLDLHDLVRNSARRA